MTQFEKDNAQNLKTIANAMVKIAKQFEKQETRAEKSMEKLKTFQEMLKKPVNEGAVLLSGCYLYERWDACKHKIYNTDPTLKIMEAAWIKWYDNEIQFASKNENVIHALHRKSIYLNELINEFYSAKINLKFSIIFDDKDYDG